MSDSRLMMNPLSLKSEKIQFLYVNAFKDIAMRDKLQTTTLVMLQKITI